MRAGEKGFTAVELMLALGIMAIIASAASTSTFQILRGTERSNKYITAVRHVENAGYWLSRDAQRAESVAYDDLEPPNFLILAWTEWVTVSDPVYHTATYSFANLTDGVGVLTRNHWSNAGASEQTLVSDYIYYAPGDPEKTSKVSYTSPVLTLQLTSLFSGVMETREYKIGRRPNF